MKSMTVFCVNVTAAGCAWVAYEGFQTRADSKLQWRIVIAIFELQSVHTREKTSPSLRFSIPERGEKHGSFLYSSDNVHADCYFIWDRTSIKCAVYWWKSLEGHVALPPKSQFRGQGIHTMTLLCDLRDVSPENTSGPSFALCNSNYASWCKFVYTQFQNTVIWMMRNPNDHSNCTLCSCVKVL